jgi:hypothetical protein
MVERVAFSVKRERLHASRRTPIRRYPDLLFVRFGDVFEGFLPARRLRGGDYFELTR